MFWKVQNLFYFKNINIRCLWNISLKKIGGTHYLPPLVLLQTFREGTSKKKVLHFEVFKQLVYLSILPVFYRNISNGYSQYFLKIWAIKIICLDFTGTGSFQYEEIKVSGAKLFWWVYYMYLISIRAHALSNLLCFLVYCRSRYLLYPIP